jgi:hypothetical protein
LRKAGQPVPSAIKIRLLVDTGASCTCIDALVLKKLGITPTGLMSIHTPSTGAAPHLCNVYDVAISILDPVQNHTWPVMPVAESDLSSQGIDGLLGRDALSGMLLIYDGKAGRLTLGY